MKIKRITWTTVAIFTLFLVFGIFYLLKNTSITVSGKSETGKVRNEKGKSIQYIMIDKTDKHDYFSKLGIKGYNEKPSFEKEEKSGKKSTTKKQKTSDDTDNIYEAEYRENQKKKTPNVKKQKNSSSESKNKTNKSSEEKKNRKKKKIIKKKTR